VACLLSIGAFDLWFVPPYHTFDVHDAAYFLTFAVMLAVALIMSQLTSRIRGTSQCAEAEALVVPIRSSSRVTGIVTVKPDSPERQVSSADRLTVEAMVDFAGVTFERTVLA
jgi:K+-sensing histidine kinase KdpD